LQLRLGVRDLAPEVALQLRHFGPHVCEVGLRSQVREVDPGLVPACQRLHLLPAEARLLKVQDRGRGHEPLPACRAIAWSSSAMAASVWAGPQPTAAISSATVRRSNLPASASARRRRSVLAWSAERPPATR